jgi:hypothetical protein
MDKQELKDLIAECVEEVAMEEGWGADLWKGVKKQFAGDPESGASHYDRFSKMHDKRADYKNTFDPKKPGPGGGKQSKMRAGARKSLGDIKVEFETKIKKMLRDAYIEGESVGMNRQDITKAFRSSLTGIFNKYKKLEEIADEVQ